GSHREPDCRPVDNAGRPEKTVAAVMAKGHGGNADRRRPPDPAPSTRRGEPFASPTRDDAGDDPRGGSRTRASAPEARRYCQPNDPGSASTPRHRRQFRRRSDARSVLSFVREPPANRQLSRPYPNSFPERWDGSRSPDKPGRQCEGAQDAHPARLALAALSARQQPGMLVSRACRNLQGPPRRIAIVAMARKLLIAIWRYATDGIVPEGA